MNEMKVYTADHYEIMAQSLDGSLKGAANAFRYAARQSRVLSALREWMRCEARSLSADIKTTDDRDTRLHFAGWIAGYQDITEELDRLEVEHGLKETR